MIDKNSINAIKYERELLSKLNHTLIINMHYAFQDYDNLYLVLDLLTGGDLRYQISRHPRQYFSEIQTKFFISCLVEALFYIHSQKIIHRDIKPENLVFDQNGYLHITDFGIAKFYSKNNSHETSGTPGYMAPEVMQGLNHKYSVDFYAIGVIIYELMMGRRPYNGKCRKEIKEQIMGKQAKINKLEIPNGWSFEAADFANKLLQRKEVNRLGFYNENNIKEHPWLKNVDMELIKNKKIKAPFLPKKNHDNYDKNYCEENEEMNFETLKRFEEYRLNKNYKDLFKGFTFYNINNLEIQNETSDIKSKTLIVHDKKNIKENDNTKKINNINFSSEKLYKSLKIIHQRYNSNISNLSNFKKDKNLNMNYSLSKIFSRKNEDKLPEKLFSPINNFCIQDYEKKLIIDNKDYKEKKSRRSKSFSLNFLKKEQIDKNIINNKLMQELNYKNIDSNNFINDNKDINNNLMKLSTNFYLPQNMNIDKKERPKSISNINIGVIIDKKSVKKNNKIKKLKNNKQFYEKKKLNKNFSQSSLQSKNGIKINNINNPYKSIINEKKPKSFSKAKIKRIININKINKNKTIIRNNSIKRNKLNITQKKIPIPKTTGKKYTHKKLNTKILLGINENNKYNFTNGTNTTKEKNNLHNKNINFTNNLCKNLLNELSFNNNDKYSNYNIQENYNTINIENRNIDIKEYNKSINTELLFSLKKVNSFKNLKTNKKGQSSNNSTKLIKNKFKINLNENTKKNNLNYLNNTNYKFKKQKKISNLYSDTSDNKSQINSKIMSFENNNYITNLINNNRTINNKKKIKSKNILIKGKIAVGNYSYQSVYSTASTGQTKVNCK